MGRYFLPSACCTQELRAARLQEGAPTTAHLVAAMLCAASKRCVDN